jgi:hypothetical protein
MTRASFYISGTSGKKKVVPYSLLSLIVGTSCVIESWDLQEADVNRELNFLFPRKKKRRALTMPSEHDAVVPRRRNRPQPSCSTYNFISYVLCSYCS